MRSYSLRVFGTSIVWKHRIAESIEDLAQQVVNLLGTCSFEYWSEDGEEGGEYFNSDHEEKFWTGKTA